MNKLTFSNGSVSFSGSYRSAATGTRQHLISSHSEFTAICFM